MIETDLAGRKNKGMLPRARRGNFYDLPGRLLNIQLFNKLYFKRYIFRGKIAYRTRIAICRRKLSTPTFLFSINFMIQFNQDIPNAFSHTHYCIFHYTISAIAPQPGVFIYRNEYNGLCIYLGTSLALSFLTRFAQEV